MHRPSGWQRSGKRDALPCSRCALPPIAPRLPYRPRLCRPLLPLDPYGGRLLEALRISRRNLVLCLGIGLELLTPRLSLLLLVLFLLGMGGCSMTSRCHGRGGGGAPPLLQPAPSHNTLPSRVAGGPQDFPLGASTTGATTTGPDATPPQLSIKTWVGGGGVGTGPHTGGDCRPARPSLRGTGPRSWLSSSKAERTRTAPMDHTVAQVSGRCCQGAGVCGRARSRGRGRTGGMSGHTVILRLAPPTVNPLRSHLGCTVQFCARPRTHL